MNLDFLKPILAQAVRDGLRTIGMGLATHGFIQNGAGVESFVGAGMTLAGLVWGWWTTTGHVQAATLLKKLTDTKTAAGAVAVAQAMAPQAGTVATVQAKSSVAADIGTAAAKLALVLAIGSIAMAQFTPAHAQLKKPQVTGNIIEDIKANTAAGVTPGQGLDATWAKMKEVSLTDIQYAKSLADAISSPRSKIRSTCYGAWITVIQQSQGATAGPNGQPLGALPDPALFSHFEQAVEVIDNLQPDSPFMVACQPAANLLKQSILQFVTSAVGGVTSLGALGVGIP